MPPITIEEAQAKLPELIAGLGPGEQLVILQNGEQLATLTRALLQQQWPSKAGSYQKADFWMAPDFDAPLDEFKEYME